MDSQIKILLTSFIISVIVALIILPILKKLKVRTNRKRIWTKNTFDKTRNSYNGRNNNSNNLNNNDDSVK